MAAADTSLLNYLGKHISFIDLEAAARFPEYADQFNDFKHFGLVVAVQVPHPDTPIESSLLVQETTGLNYYDFAVIQIISIQ